MQGSSNCSTYNNGNFAIESWNGGLNFWNPWPTFAAGNYKLYIRNSGMVGIGMHPNLDYINTLQVNGKVKANGYNTWSDSRLKENIAPVENALEKVLKLSAVSYNYLPGLDIHKPNIDLDQVDEIKRKTIENENNGLHPAFAEDKRFGYLAQDVEKIIPEIVETDEKGYLSMDYMDLIPLAMEAIKEQQQTIDQLSSELENIKALNQLVKLPNNVGIKATLFQNNPNPFDQSTSISYEIASAFEDAQIVVSDFYGETRATHTISSQGKASFTLEANSLEQGTYYYSLIVNGVIVDTRLMFLIK